MCVTLGVVPLIRCPRGGAAEHVAGLLDAKLRDALKSRTNLFSEGVVGLSAPLTRPLLALFDRNFDLTMMLQQGWSYKPLVQDVLGMRLNRITIQAEAASGAGSSAPAPGVCRAAVVMFVKMMPDKKVLSHLAGSGWPGQNGAWTLRQVCVLSWLFEAVGNSGWGLQTTIQGESLTCSGSLAPAPGLCVRPRTNLPLQRSKPFFQIHCPGRRDRPASAPGALL